MSEEKSTQEKVSSVMQRLESAQTGVAEVTSSIRDKLLFAGNDFAIQSQESLHQLDVAYIAISDAIKELDSISKAAYSRSR